MKKENVDRRELKLKLNKKRKTNNNCENNNLYISVVVKERNLIKKI